MAKTMTYSKQVANAWTQSKTLSVENYLVLPTEDEVYASKRSPMFMHSGMSRFYMTIIDTKQQVGGRSAAISANIPAADIDLAKLKTDAIVQMSMAEQVSVEKGSTPAYTIPIMGRFNKKTAADILLSEPDRKDELSAQIDFLQANVAKYPANQKQIDAIKEALSLFEAGKLKGTGQKVSEKIIYESECKYFPSRKDERGRQVCYKVKISYDPLSASPVHIMIDNFVAPLVKSKIGTMVIKLSEADKRLLGTMDLSLDKWFEIITRMAKTKADFETINFPKMAKWMEEISWKPERISVS
jgi:hypothetical protein